MTFTTGRREVFLGVDVGTQGVRVAALDETGDLVAAARRPFPLANLVEEQSPEDWWDAVLAALKAVAADLTADARLVPVALSVTATSGTVVPLDDNHHPLHDALMYSDKRATAKAAEVMRLAPELGSNLSWAIPKILWFCNTYPEVTGRIATWRHAGDLILGRLTGEWGVTDATSALKTGYDPVAERWSPALSQVFDLPESWLPRVVPSGTVLGPLDPKIATATGLPASILVTTGMTDGCASQVASGAARPGDWSTTIGTTMVVKGVTRTHIADPSGVIYSHRHPDGLWMPGGASNTGAEWIARDYAGQDLDRLEVQAAAQVPTGAIAYPLRQEGERFPFLAAAARGFDPAGLDGPSLFAARLEGTAYLERLALERLEHLSGEPSAAVFAAGGGSQSRLWLQIRASVLARPIRRTHHSEAAAGAAIVAAAATRFRRLAEAADALTAIALTVEPDGHVDAYDEGYHRFLAALTARGYLQPEGSR